jgi:phospholipid-transporting ATPase
MESSRPFASSGAMPAGFTGMGEDKQYHPSKGYGGGGADFLDDDEEPSPYAFSASHDGPYSGRQRGRWARIKEDYLTDVDWTFGVNKLLGRRSKFDGMPRDIALNDPEANKVKGFESNAVSTGKYGPITFLPKFLFCKRLLLS